MTQYEEEILRSLRRITRAIDLYSRELASGFGLTGPQLVCLRTLAAMEACTPSRLAREVDLSQATITGIVDRLEAQGLVRRQRDKRDRRKVSVHVTDAGRALLERAPSPLHSRFLKRLSELPEPERQAIRSTLELVVTMMDAEELDAAPLLTTGPVSVSADQVTTLLDQQTAPPNPSE